ncbi:MAG: FAD-dependent oxidoreductase [Gallionella sp.]|nr:FAD-dependent oxidoreductase [Gallionella sp.]
MKPIVVLGSGLAGYTLVRELRKLNREIAITLVSRDSGDYYSKPMLSNAFAQGKDASSLVLTAAAVMAKQLDITMLADCDVRAIDRTSKQLDTTAGVIEYDRLVLALGADPIRIPLQGDAAEAVLSVNDLSDYAQLRERLATAKSVAIMGGGLIGCEFANDLAVAGYEVSVIDPGPYPLASLMPEQAGGQLLKPLADLGVRWHFGVAVQRVDKALSGYALTLTDGTVIHADLVLSAIGLRPRVQLAREAGLEVNRGIVVNERLQSSDAAIFALGDCAEIDGKVLPFVLPIMHAGRALAKILNGDDTQVIFPAMPVVVKTPAHPIAVSPVARDALGSWRTLASGNGISMGFFDPQDRITGFVLTGVYAGERNEMAKKINN